MLQILKKEYFNSVLVFIYAISCYLLALSPVWIFYLFVNSSYQTDKFGSGADAFVWFYYLAWTFTIYALLQLVALLVRKKFGWSYQLKVLMPSLVIWFCSFLLLRFVN